MPAMPWRLAPDCTGSRECACDGNEIERIVLMTTPAASEIGSDVHVFDPVAYAASLLVILTSCVLAATIPALHAARIDPIATLRQN
jgi:ABC-type lipoprotein release transport system permease subunit